MENYGRFIKEIRLGKGYSQQYVSEDICSQGNYSKIEKSENQDIKFTSINRILNRLEMSFEEFSFISHNYEMPKRQKILHSFYTQIFNSENALLSLKNECEVYLRKYPKDILIFNIKTVLEGMLLLAKSNDFTQASELLLPIWKELSNRNTLYLADIYLLNAILLVFPKSTATKIKEFACRHLAKYRGYFNVNKLKINFLMNLAMININEADFETALTLLDEAIAECKNEKSFIKLALCYVRKGICLHKLQITGEDYIEKGLTLLRHLEELELVTMYEQEVLHFK